MFPNQQPHVPGTICFATRTTTLRMIPSTQGNKCKLLSTFAICPSVQLYLMIKLLKLFVRLVFFTREFNSKSTGNSLICRQRCIQVRYGYENNLHNESLCIARGQVAPRKRRSASRHHPGSDKMHQGRRKYVGDGHVEQDTMVGLFLLFRYHQLGEIGAADDRNGTSDFRKDDYVGRDAPCVFRGVGALGR